MSTEGEAIKRGRAIGEKILEALEIAGVENWADSSIVIRCRFKVAPLCQWDVRREFLKRLKLAFDQCGIEIPYPHLTVIDHTDKFRG